MIRSRKRVTRSRQFSARTEKDLFRSTQAPLPKGLPSSASKRPQGRGARPTADLNDWFGPQSHGRRKIARPFQAGREMEALFRSRRARGKWAFDRPRNQAAVSELLQSEAGRSNVALLFVHNGRDSILIRFRADDRADLSRFFRAVGGKIPRLVAGAEKTRPLSRGALRSTHARRFWDGLVATRIV